MGELLTEQRVCELEMKLCLQALFTEGQGLDALRTEFRVVGGEVGVGGFEITEHVVQLKVDRQWCLLPAKLDILAHELFETALADVVLQLHAWTVVEGLGSGQKVVVVL